MKINFKWPGLLGKSLLIASIPASILIGIVIFWTEMPQKAEAETVLVSNTEEIRSFSVLRGNTFLPASNPSDPEPKIIRKINVVLTAYSSTVWQTDETPFITASGTKVRDGIVANNYFPIGTKIRIPELYGDKIFVVEDRMSRIKGNYQIDIWFSDYWQALNFGAKRTYIEVLES